jgi:hypothetical protein
LGQVTSEKLGVTYKGAEDIKYDCRKEMMLIAKNLESNKSLAKVYVFFFQELGRLMHGLGNVYGWNAHYHSAGQDRVSCSVLGTEASLPFPPLSCLLAYKKWISLRTN